MRAFYPNAISLVRAQVDRVLRLTLAGMIATYVACRAWASGPTAIAVGAAAWVAWAAILLGPFARWVLPTPGWRPWAGLQGPGSALTWMRAPAEMSPTTGIARDSIGDDR